VITLVKAATAEKVRMASSSKGEVGGLDMVWLAFLAGSNSQKDPACTHLCLLHHPWRPDLLKIILLLLQLGLCAGGEGRAGAQIQNERGRDSESRGLGSLGTLISPRRNKIPKRSNKGRLSGIGEQWLREFEHPSFPQQIVDTSLGVLGDPPVLRMCKGGQ
jgi:hypothetical protein